MSARSHSICAVLDGRSKSDLLPVTAANRIRDRLTSMYIARQVTSGLEEKENKGQMIGRHETEDQEAIIRFRSKYIALVFLLASLSEKN